MRAFHIHSSNRVASPRYRLGIIIRSFLAAKQKNPHITLITRKKQNGPTSPASNSRIVIISTWSSLKTVESPHKQQHGAATLRDRGTRPVLRSCPVLLALSARGHRGPGQGVPEQPHQGEAVLCLQCCDAGAVLRWRVAVVFFGGSRRRCARRAVCALRCTLRCAGLRILRAEQPGLLIVNVSRRPIVPIVRTELCVQPAASARPLQTPPPHHSQHPPNKQTPTTPRQQSEPRIRGL